VIYIFTDATGGLSLYYDIELREPLGGKDTGGAMFPTTTIITKNRIHVPVPKVLEEAFQITDGAKEFYVRFDTIPQRREARTGRDPMRMTRIRLCAPLNPRRAWRRSLPLPHETPGRLELVDGQGTAFIARLRSGSFEGGENRLAARLVDRECLEFAV